jgi:hypothetical protein
VSEPNYISSRHLTVSYIAMAQCVSCRVRVPIEVDTEDLRRLRAFQPLRRTCARCQEETEWQYLPLGVSR